MNITILKKKDALALTYSKTDFEINFDGTMYDAGINIKWPYQENKQYKNLIYVEVIFSFHHYYSTLDYPTYKVTYMDYDFK